MARYAYERLSAQDASFLWAERDNQPMHVGALAIHEAGPLAVADGGIDIERYRRAVESVLHWIPRYRQRIEWTPVEGWPVWVDDRQFDLGYHIRHIALPKPGGLEQLKELAGRIHSRGLDRRHPLWETWVIEGLAGGEQFAVLNKIHHCMIDGAAGADLSQILLSPSSKAGEGEAVPYMPRPAPSRLELLGDAVIRAALRPLELVRTAASAALSEDSGAPGLSRRLAALGELVRYSAIPASETPINGTLGPHRRLDWLTLPLEDVKELRGVLQCTINDVVLTTVCGAMRRYLFRRRVDTRSIEFRIAAPVSTRRPEHDRRQGNHVSTWIVPLPIDVADPLEQLDGIQKRTEELKQSEASLGVDTLMQAAEWLPVPLLSRAVALAEGTANMIVTNVPGPQFPLFSVGARMLAMYPLVPLLPGGGLGIALFSYDGMLCWGFNGDYELAPDLPVFASDVSAAFEELRAAAVARYMELRTAKRPSEESAAEEPRRAKDESTVNAAAPRVQPSEASPVQPLQVGEALPAVRAEAPPRATGSGSPNRAPAATH